MFSTQYCSKSDVSVPSKNHTFTYDYNPLFFNYMFIRSNNNFLGGTKQTLYVEVSFAAGDIAAKMIASRSHNEPSVRHWLENPSLMISAVVQFLSKNRIRLLRGNPITYKYRVTHSLFPPSTRPLFNSNCIPS